MAKLKYMPYAQAHITITDCADENNNDYTLVKLISYETVVVTVKVYEKEMFFHCTGLYSATTRKHISAFMRELYPDFGYCFIRDYCVNNVIKVDSLGHTTNISTGEYLGII